MKLLMSKRRVTLILRLCLVRSRTRGVRSARCSRPLVPRRRPGGDQTGEWVARGLPRWFDGRPPRTLPRVLCRCKLWHARGETCPVPGPAGPLPRGGWPQRRMGGRWDWLWHGPPALEWRGPASGRSAVDSGRPGFAVARELLVLLWAGRRLFALPVGSVRGVLRLARQGSGDFHYPAGVEHRVIYAA